MPLNNDDLVKLQVITDQMIQELKFYRRMRTDVTKPGQLALNLTLGSLMFGLGPLMSLMCMTDHARDYVKSGKKKVLAEVAIQAIDALYQKAKVNTNKNLRNVYLAAGTWSVTNHKRFELNLTVLFNKQFNTLDECIFWLWTTLGIINDEDNHIEKRYLHEQLNLDGSSACRSRFRWDIPGVKPGLLHKALDNCFHLIKEFSPVKEAIQGKSWVVQQDQDRSSLFDVDSFDITYDDKKIECIDVTDFAAKTQPAVAPRGKAAMFQQFNNPVYEDDEARQQYQPSGLAAPTFSN